jgi:hypothetical protein
MNVQEKKTRIRGLPFSLKPVISHATEEKAADL